MPTEEFFPGDREMDDSGNRYEGAAEAWGRSMGEGMLAILALQSPS